MRSSARETAFKYLFAKLFGCANEELLAFIAKDEKLTEQDYEFARKLSGFVLSDYEAYLNDVERLVRGYKLSRVYNADKCIIILGMAELKNCTETPIPVIIDEAVKIAAKYSTDKSTDFVNGVLAEYANEVRNG